MRHCCCYVRKTRTAKNSNNERTPEKVVGEIESFIDIIFDIRNSKRWMERRIGNSRLGGRLGRMRRGCCVGRHDEDNENRERKKKQKKGKS
uniref:Uncharacterized protein n=1 Tax=Manihot esculenta TaxID=3983 RepID=A0A2C9VF96_MANES